jgi:hypothetical protein
MVFPIAETVAVNSVIDIAILPAHEFNSSIADIHDQHDLPTDPAIVAALADVFQKHNVQDCFGIHLLHRHFILPEGHIMFKQPPVDSDISLTKITKLDVVDINKIRGALYFLNDMGKFQAYEFEYGDPLDIPPAFLQDLSSRLKEFGLEKVVALDVSGGPVNRTFPKALEYTIGTFATVTVETKGSFESHRLTGVSFAIRDGKAWPEATDGYSPNNRGTHSVFYEKALGSRLPGEADDMGDTNFNAKQLRDLLVLNGILP